MFTVYYTGYKRHLINAHVANEPMGNHPDPLLHPPHLDLHNEIIGPDEDHDAGDLHHGEYNNFFGNDTT